MAAESEPRPPDDHGALEATVSNLHRRCPLVLCARHRTARSAPNFSDRPRRGEKLRHLSITKPQTNSRGWIIASIALVAAALAYEVNQIVSVGFQFGQLFVIIVVALIPGMVVLSFLQPTVPRGLEAFYERRYRPEARPRR